MPRKVVGEAMIVNVQERTATAVIVRSVQEIHTGDYVQLKWNTKPEASSAKVEQK
jgi:hypothetical protein